MSSGVPDFISRRWNKLPFLWKFQILFWTIFVTVSFPVAFIGIRYVMRWQAPLYAMVFLKVLEIIVAILTTWGFAKIMETQWFRRTSAWGKAGWICVGTLMIMAFIDHVESPLIFRPIYHYYGDFPRTSDPHERFVKYFAANTYQFLVYSGWALMYLLFRTSSEARRKELDLHASELKRRESEILMLRSQLNPHFLFNAMNTIVSESGGNPKVDQLVEGISEYLRYSLSNRSRVLVLLEEEIEATRRYLEVQTARFAGTLEFEIEADARSRAFAVPGIFLQPLVENALKYGGKDVPPPLRIRILCRSSGGTLEVEVANTGSWVPPSAPEDRREGGVGLENLRARLALLYPGRHEFEIRSADGWSSVRIILSQAPDEPPA